jgi:hypothetical protein
MLTATCHCGAVNVEVPRRPRTLTDCNCSLCRRYGVLWSYYKAGDVKVRAKRGATDEYIWGDKTQRFVRCKTCGCVMTWAKLSPRFGSRAGVNARNFEAGVIDGIRVRRLDGADTWKYLD